MPSRRGALAVGRGETPGDAGHGEMWIMGERRARDSSNGSRAHPAAAGVVGEMAGGTLNGYWHGNG